MVHQSTLLHGVNTRSGERWSWILWYRDSAQCEDHSHEWFEECAKVDRDPVCQLLLSTRPPPGIDAAAAMHHTLRWTRDAADNGLAAAMYKLGRAALKMLPSPLPYDPLDAMRWFRRSIDSSNEPDGHYSLAQMLLEGTAHPTQQELQSELDQRNPDDERGGHSASGGAASQPPNEYAPMIVTYSEGSRARSALLQPDDHGLASAVAVSHFERAAQGGHVFAMYNLGIAHLYGLGVARRDPDLAAQWFEACGLPEGMFVVAMHRRASGKHEEAKEWEERASKLGFGKSWRKLARDRTGSGGVGGVNLHSAWDRHLQPGQEGPPTDW